MLDEAQWGDLWDDLLAFVPEGDGLPSTKPFVGYIVTQQGDGALKNVVPFMVIDSQPPVIDISLTPVTSAKVRVVSIGALMRQMGNAGKSGFY